MQELYRAVYITQIFRCKQCYEVITESFSAANGVTIEEGETIEQAREVGGREGVFARMINFLFPRETHRPERDFLYGSIQYRSMHSLDIIFRDSILKKASGEICHEVRMAVVGHGETKQYLLKPGIKPIDETAQVKLAHQSDYLQLESTRRLLENLSNKEWISEGDLRRRFEDGKGHTRGYWGLGDKIETALRVGFIQTAPDTTQIMFSITKLGLKFLKGGIMTVLEHEKGLVRGLHLAILEWNDGIASLKGLTAGLTQNMTRLLTDGSIQGEDKEEREAFLDELDRSRDFREEVTKS